MGRRKVTDVYMAAIFIILISVREAPAKNIKSFAGPFIVVLREIVDCPRSISGRNMLLTRGIIAHKNSTTEPVFNGQFYLLQPLDDTETAWISFASWNTVAGWVPNSFNFEFKRSCTSLFKNAREIIGSVLRFCKERPPLSCPLEKRNYTIENLPTAYRLKAFPIFQYGKWRIYVQLFQKSGIAACVQVETHTVPSETMACIIKLATSLTFIVSYISNLEGKAYHSFAGPYVAVLKEITNCPPDESGKNLIVLKGLISHKNSSKNPVYNGIIYTLLPLDDAPTATIQLASWSPVSGWRPNSMQMIFKNFCSSLLQYGHEIIATVLAYCKPRIPLTCPLQQGNYTAENMPTAFHLKHLPVFPYGKWRSYVQLDKNGVRVACVQVELHTVPVGTVLQTVIEL